MDKVHRVPVISPIITSILGREKYFEEQKLHRDGDHGYFFIIPKTNNYEIRVFFYIHIMNHFLNDIKRQKVMYKSYHKYVSIKENLP